GLLRALVADNPEARIECTDGTEAPPISIRLVKPGAGTGSPAPTAAAVESPAGGTAPAAAGSGTEPAAFRRHVVTLQPEPVTSTPGAGSGLLFLSADTLVLTDDARLVDALDA